MSNEALTVEFDPGQLAALKKALDPKRYADFLDATGTDLAHIGEGAAKEATPVVTGHARRETTSDVKPPEKVVEAHYPYFNWLDAGVDSRGRQMKTRPGGYQIRARAMDAAVAAAPTVLDRAGREVAERWAE